MPRKPPAGYTNRIDSRDNEPFLPDDARRGMQYIAERELTGTFHSLAAEPKSRVSATDDEMLADAKTLLGGLLKRVGRLPKEPPEQARRDAANILHSSYDSLLATTDDPALKALATKYAPVAGDGADSSQRKAFFKKLLDEHDRHSNTREIIDEIAQGEKFRQFLGKHGIDIFKKDGSEFISNQAIDVLTYYAVDEDARAHMRNSLSRNTSHHLGDSEEPLDLMMDALMQAKYDAPLLMFHALHYAKSLPSAQAKTALLNIEQPETLIKMMDPKAETVALYAKYAPGNTHVPEDAKEEFHRMYAEQSAAAHELLNVITQGKGRNLS